MFAQERHHRIGELVRKHRRLNFRDLLKLAGGSPATLRRDLAEMETAGAIIRVHGGVLDPGYVRLEPSFSERVVRNRPAKRRMAEAAAALVPSGAVVIIDAGSTCLEVGKALLGRKDVRLITHSFALLEAAFRGEAPMVCLGGELRRVSGALTGASALGALEKLRADIAFIGWTRRGGGLLDDRAFRGRNEAEDSFPGRAQHRGGRSFQVETTEHRAIRRVGRCG
jgi:DeoR/GlpR family transcriptional regulator of sugar metabolism